MHLDTPEPVIDPRAQAAADRRRFVGALVAALAATAALVAIYIMQGLLLEPRGFAVVPGSAAGLVGVATAPLLHGSPAHLLANATAILMLGTLAGAVYPKATLRGLPLAWLGSGLAAWLLGDPGSHHLGASGVTHGLMFLLLGLGVLRRDRPAIAAAMIAFLFYGGMLLTVLPQEPGVSWQSHLGGAVGGLLAAWCFRNADPRAPRRRYSWEVEDALAAERGAGDDDTLEPARPDRVPVLWRREDPSRGTVLRFPPRRGDDD